MSKRGFALATALVGGFWAAHAVADPAPPPPLPTSYLYSFVGITDNLLANRFEVDLEDFQTTGTASVAGQVPGLPAAPIARGQASAQYGVLGALAETFGQAQPFPDSFPLPGGYAAVAGAIFTDSFTITGGTGTAFTSTTLSGVVGPNPDALMAYVLLKSTAPFNDLEALEIQLGEIIATGMLPTGLEVVHAAIATPSLPLDPLPTGSYSYTDGVPIYLAGVLLTYAEQDGSAIFNATARFGITPTGSLLTDSGLVYAQAVPEPGTWAMMIAGVALLGFVARRRVARA